MSALWQAIPNFRVLARAEGRAVHRTRRTKREAEKALAELIVRRDREGLVRANHTLGQAVTKWREAKEQTGAPSSLLRYDIALRTYLLPRLGDIQLRKLTADMLDRYCADLSRAGIADNTIFWHHQLISNILRYTMRTLRWVGENVALDANPPRRRTTSVQVPEGEQVAKLIEQPIATVVSSVRLFVSPSSRAHAAASSAHRSGATWTLSGPS